MKVQNTGRFIILFGVLTALLAGCAQLPGSDVPEDQLTPAQQRLRERSAAFNKTIWQGAATGAVAGALFGLVTGNDQKDILKGALIGGAAGALAGSYIASKQRQYANREDQLNSMIADVQQKNREAVVLIASMEEVIAEDRRRIASLRQQQRRGEISEARLQQALKSARADRAKIAEATENAQEQLGVFQESREVYSKTNPDVDTRGLDQEIENFQARINTMNDIVADLSAAELG